MKISGAFVLITAVLMLALIVGLVSHTRDRGDISGKFNSANINQTRQALTPSVENSPHGQISIDYIKHLNDNFYNRFSFTLREMQTAGWLVEELLAMGYTWNEIEVQEFTYEEANPMTHMGIVMDLFVFIDYTPFVNLGIHPSGQSQNVVLTVPGQSDEVIIVGAHYDSVLNPGASDNASGVALLLESAQRMYESDNYYTIEYVFFGAEEVGLFGAYYYAYILTPAEHESILFMVNADILLDGDDLFYMAGYDTGRGPGANNITETWDSIAKEVNTQHDLNLRPLPWGVFGPSDHLAFLPHGHTVMLLAALDVTGEIPDEDIMMFFYEMNRVLHTPNDDIHYMIETWPDKVSTNMRTFSIFLEEILLASYYPDENGE